MGELEAMWPDPDRRDDALGRLAAKVATTETRTSLIPSERRALQALSVGLDERGAATVLGVTHETIKTQLVNARRALRAKNTTHAVAEALRQRLIA